MRNKIFLILSFLSFMGFPFLAQAGVNDDLTQFFNKLGGSSNITRSGAYQDQTAGFYTGGKGYF